MFRFLCLLCFALLFTFNSAYAQREQLIIRTEFAPASNLAGGGEVEQFSHFFSYARRDLLNKNGTAILTSTLSYRQTQLNYDFGFGDVITTEINPPRDYRFALQQDGLTLHTLQADFLFMKILNRKWMLYALGRPVMLSDFDGVDVEDFRFEAAVFTEYGFSRKFRAGLGLSRSSSFGRVLWIPLARILYRPARKVLIDGILPSRLDAWYIPSKQWELGLGLSLVGGQFSVGENALGGNQFGWANGLATLQVKRLIQGKWYAQLDAGFSLVPRQEITDYDFGLFPARDILLDFEPDPMPVFRAGIFRVF